MLTSRRQHRQPAPGRMHDRGAVAVEAALIFPVLILLVFGIIEFALLMRDHVATSSIVRAGARTASAAANPTALPVAGVPQFVQTTVEAMERASSALPKDSYDTLWVYKAGTNGYPIGATGPNYFEPADCSTRCIRYTWSDTRDAFRPVDVNGWPQSTIRACPGTTFDAVGVYLAADHQWLTGFFGTTTKVSDRAVLNFEPFPLDSCA